MDNEKRCDSIGILAGLVTHFTTSAGLGRQGLSATTVALPQSNVILSLYIALNEFSRIVSTDTFLYELSEETNT